jgi:competence protein ComEA
MDTGELREALRVGSRELQGLALLVGAALAGLVALWLLGRPAALPEQAVPAAPLVADAPVVVHVAGHVARPGLYTLPGGSRVDTALAAAGGPLPDAALDGLNLARPLEDGEQLLVPSEAEAQAAAARGASRADGRLDLNRAGTTELEALPGIGPVLAQRIVSWREGNGGFRSVRDLRRVQGIGEKLYAALAELVAV